MLIDFNEDTTYEAKLQVLLKHHNISKNFIVDGDDIPMLVMALNQDDISTVKVDDEGAIEIGYYGESWQNNE